MKFKLDENLPEEACDLLRQAGHDAQTAHAQGLSGSLDEALIRACLREGRALVTLDVGFADILAYPPAEYPGLVVLRLANQAKAPILHALTGLVGSLPHEPLSGRLWVVEGTRIRIR
jgi:predicted nuclease of predicted toxin-antitoxin system